MPVISHVGIRVGANYDDIKKGSLVVFYNFYGLCTSLTGAATSWWILQKLHYKSVEQNSRNVLHNDLFSQFLYGKRREQYKIICFCRVLFFMKEKIVK